jgi:UDPglucose 6-dehydrogenase
MGSEENMKVCVYGLGHLGSVTAACLASVGHEVYGMQFGVFGPEPKLNELYKEMLEKGALRVGNDRDRIREAEVLWVTFDTPVDDNDRADVDYVLGKVREVMPYVAESTPVIVSSQLPVGTIRKLEGEFPRHTFVCIPENLRHGTAVENFLHPDRIVVGVRPEADRRKILELLIPILNGKPIEPNDLWIPAGLRFMSIESAEMTKHAINAFLATSICFINEIAAICELVGADPKEVERGLKTEARIGPKAYLKPGGPYTGKTLARDVEYLDEVNHVLGSLCLPLLESLKRSNGMTTIRERIKHGRA